MPFTQKRLEAWNRAKDLVDNVLTKYVLVEYEQSNPQPEYPPIIHSIPEQYSELIMRVADWLLEDQE